MVTMDLTLVSLESRMPPKPETSYLFLPRDPSEKVTLQVSLPGSRGISLVLAMKFWLGSPQQSVPSFQSAFVITKRHDSYYLSTFTVSVHCACSLSQGSTRIQSDVCRASRAMATR